MLTPEQIEVLDHLKSSGVWDKTNLDCLLFTFEYAQKFAAAVERAVLDEAIAALKTNALFISDGNEYNQGICDAAAVLMNLKEKKHG